MFRLTRLNKFHLCSVRYASSGATAPLVLDVGQLRELRHQNESISLLDASWFMPNAPRNPYNEFLAKRIPGAQFLDIDGVSSIHELGLKHMMPSGQTFASACQQLGVSPSSHVVIYDTHGVFSSPRALFMFRAFGHSNSSILNGGLPRWEHEGQAVETEQPLPPLRAQYPSATLDESVIRNYEQIVNNSSHNPTTSAEAELVLDARSSGRFAGTDPEPRPGLPSGHIPNSISLPFNVFLQTVKREETSYTTLLPLKELESALRGAVGESHADSILSGKARVVTSCGSGMSAGILWLGLQLLGVQNVGLYDESWTGYAMRSSSKIARST